MPHLLIRESFAAWNGDVGVARKDRLMKISGIGAGVGAAVGLLARGAVVVLNVGLADERLLMLALPSAAIGALVGAIAGAIGKPLRGALVGAILSGVVFEFFMFACASLIGQFNQKAGGDFLTETLIYGLEMALAGAIAGGVGGAVGKLRRTREPSQRKGDRGVPPA
jgi:hypothetical protein